MTTIEALSEVRRAWRWFVRAIAQELLSYAGGDDDMGGTKPSDPDDGVDEE